MGCICFVILHYNGIDDTEKCIQSIQQLDGQQDIRIVLVDNASPNGTGRQLADRYMEDEKIDVLCREENDGFSRGNNAGCEFAIRKWDPDFLVAANNDVIFEQKEFTTLLRETYQKERFAVLGPDIYAPVMGVHQSPISDILPNKRQVDRTIFLNSMVLRLYPIFYPLMRRYYAKLEIRAGLPHDVESTDVCVMGACIVFSREYFEERTKIFEPETRFYYEENIMLLWCRQNKKTVLYRPELKVLHMEGRATGTIAGEDRDRIRFRMQNIVDAAGIYRDYLGKLGEDGVSASLH